MDEKETFWPLSMNLTAKSSFDDLSRTSFATPKLPDPISFTISYLSMFCNRKKTELLCSLDITFWDRSKDEEIKHTCVCLYKENLRASGEIQTELHCFCSEDSRTNWWEKLWEMTSTKRNKLLEVYGKERF